ncbi:hypothetical protein V7O66_08425 [Methanolobus sp. ZRKC3]|uniref:hypothetical protein n=1 Tax=Methanolobus sp. ZRKC3 TaxID=3125786 RepID=UPI00324B893C
MGAIELFNFVDLAIRLGIVVLSLLISNLLIKIDADVIRSRIYVSFGKLKGYFFLLTIGFFVWFAAAIFIVNGTSETLVGSLMILFQLLVLFFLYHLYVAIRVPDRRIL